MFNGFRVASIALLAAWMLPLASSAQRQDQNPARPQPVSPFPQPQSPISDDPDIARTQSDMAKKANHGRHALIKKDTDQLLVLATELKQSVDKSDENMLSVDVIRKADEIEKLARTVRENMRGSY